MEAELDERFLRGISPDYNFLRMDSGQSNLLVHIEFPEYLRCVQKMLVLKDPVTQVSPAPNAAKGVAHFFALYASNGRFRIRAIQYPLIRKSAVRKACTAASGTM